MKASEVIKQLEQLISEHGDLPVANLELDSMYDKVVFVESGGIEGVYYLNSADVFYNEADIKKDTKKIFVLD